MTKVRKRSNFDRMRRRRIRKMRKQYGKPYQSNTISIYGTNGGQLAKATEQAGTGGSGIPFDPTILFYWLILAAYIAIMVAGCHRYNANF